MNNKTTAHNPTAWTEIPEGPHDIKMVVADMDGTLLDGESEVPEGFWSLLQLMEEQDIYFVPASGRQYATLKNQFGHIGDHVSYIAENGNLVVHRDEPVSFLSVSNETVQEVIRASREAAKERNSGLVVCGVKSAYVERHDAPFVAECDKYYAQLAQVDDLTEVEDDVLKLAIYDFDDSETAYAGHFKEAARGYQAVLSGKHWVDVMNPDADKGKGVTKLQEVLGITPEQTAIFGDYLNDLEMLDAGRWSFAMENAHPGIKEAANYLAPANTEDGVGQVLKRLLGIAAS